MNSPEPSRFSSLKDNLDDQHFAEHKECSGFWIHLMFSIAAIISVGEEPGPIDLPIIDDTVVVIALVLVNDQALRGALVPAQPELRHVQLNREKLVRAHVVKVSVHFIFVASLHRLVFPPPN